MKRNISHFFVIFILFNFFSYSQKEYIYIGGIKLNDSTLISYKINFDNKFGKIKGYSITDIGGEHETRSNIFGEYDENNKELSFRETGIVYTKSPVSENDFCFLNTTIKNFTFGETKKIKANFIGLFSDNTQCINGEILLSTLEKVEERIVFVSKKINKSNKIPDSTKQKYNSLKLMDSLNINILRKNQTLTVFTNKNKVNLIIYDGGKLDGDIITISANETIVLNKYKANNLKKIIPIIIEEKKTSIIIKADNEGLISPNTIVVEIDDDNNYIKALSNLRFGELTQIDILKK